MPLPAGLVRRAVNVVAGTSLIAGVLVLLFVAYQLWGAALYEARAQDDMRAELVASFPQPVVDGPIVIPPNTTTTPAPVLAPPPALGEPVAVLRIPRIGLDKVVVEGTGRAELKMGPGHYPMTPLPGRTGNVAIAGHRTTYGAPFWAINELQPGDEILLSTVDGDVRYLVTGSKVVDPIEVSVLRPTGTDTLTLTTCEPRYSARSRLIVSARLDGEPFDAPRAVEAPVPTVRPLRADIPDTYVTPESEAPLVDDRAGDRLSWAIALPGLATGLLAWTAWRVSRRTRRWWPLALAVAPVAIGLLVLFERVAAVLPSTA